jgi:hypothetical protein
VRITYPVIGSCNRLGFPRYLNTPSEGFGKVSPFRRFHSIAAFCGNGLRSEPQALFERLAVDSAFDTASRPPSTHSKRKGCSRRSTPKHTRTYLGFFTGLFRISAPEIHRLLHRVIHRFSTIFPPIVDRLVLRQIAGRAALCRGAQRGRRRWDQDDVLTTRRP